MTLCTELKVPEQALDEILLGLNMSYIHGVDQIKLKAGKSSHTSQTQSVQCLELVKCVLYRRSKYRLMGLLSFTQATHLEEE